MFHGCKENDKWGIMGRYRIGSFLQEVSHCIMGKDGCLWCWSRVISGGFLLKFRNNFTNTKHLQKINLITDVGCLLIHLNLYTWDSIKKQPSKGVHSISKTDYLCNRFPQLPIYVIDTCYKLSITLCHIIQSKLLLFPVLVKCWYICHNDTS